MSLQKDMVLGALYETDGDIKRASEILNSEYITLYSYIKRNNLDYKSKKKIHATKEQLDEAYKRLGALSLVAKELGGTKEGIRCAMKRHGLEVNKPVIHIHNDDFFAHDNELSFYWAGFIAADGCIGQRTKMKNGIKALSESYVLSIALGIKDIKHVEKFKNDIQTTAPIGIYLVKNSKRNSKWNDTEKAEIKITSQKIFTDLMRFNITQRKSLTYTFPEWVVEHKLLNHFLRGYFDGDGSFYINEHEIKCDQLYFCVRGTPKFLKVYRSILEKENLVTARDTEIRISSGQGVLEYGGNGVVAKISNYLYNNATVYLDRKYNLVEHLLDKSSK